jgi:beta-lactamase class A
MRTPLCLFLVAVAALAQPPKSSALDRLIEAELSRFPAKTGLYVKHLATGEESIHRGNDHFNSASVIKIPVMILAYRMADQKQLNLDERITNKALRFPRWFRHLSLS